VDTNQSLWAAKMDKNLVRQMGTKSKHVQRRRFYRRLELLLWSRSIAMKGSMGKVEGILCYLLVWLGKMGGGRQA
jgi:hypothetical protein